MSGRPSVSPDIVIMTRVELRALQDAAFHRGFERGRLEGAADTRKAKRCDQCVNAERPPNDLFVVCQIKGVQWQDMMVEKGYAQKCDRYREAS